MALNLENDNVGVVVFGNDTQIKEGDIVKRPATARPGTAAAAASGSPRSSAASLRTRANHPHPHPSVSNSRETLPPWRVVLPDH
jgi:hypothetical protein